MTSSRHSSFSTFSRPSPRSWRTSKPAATAEPAISLVSAGSAAAAPDAPASSLPRPDAASSLRKASHNSLRSMHDSLFKANSDNSNNNNNAIELCENGCATPAAQSINPDPVPFPTQPDPVSTNPSTDPPSPAPAPTPAPSPPQQIPPPRTWFPFSPSPAPPPTQPPPNSSVDTSVPSLPNSPSPTSSSFPPSNHTLQPESQPVQPRSRADSLNPSASRFALAVPLPLLGRAKVPLPVSMQQQQQQQQEDVQDVPQPSRDTWWGYVGWTSPTPAPAPAPEPESEPSTSTPAPIYTSPAPAPEPAPAPPVPAPSTWYTPWRWYGYGDGAPEGGKQGEESEPAPAPKTQAELVKEAALARPSPPPPPPPTVAAQDVPPLARGSWVSFFTGAGETKAASVGGGERAEVSAREGGEGATKNERSPAPSLASAPAAITTKPPTTPPSKPAKPAKSPKSPAPSTPTSQHSPTPSISPKPNLVLPPFPDTFHVPPRAAESTLRRALRRFSYLYAGGEGEEGGIGKAGGGKATKNVLNLRGAGDGKVVRRVVCIGVHGWFPGALIRQVLGEPTGTSAKFASMMRAAVVRHFGGVGDGAGDGGLEKVTEVVLEGEGTIQRRVELLYQEYLKNAEWVEDLQRADAILIATHSQGSIVSTQLLARLIEAGHIRPPAQQICVLAMCGIHLGPLRYLNTSSVVQPYLQYFESAAARELFEFQDSESTPARTYTDALRNVLEHGAKFVYIASMNDQVVPIYSGCFATAAHPLLLRALYIDGEAHSASDFLANLLVLLLRIRNAGMDDGGLLTHLSEATAGSLSGVGHSSAYEDPATYTLAVRFLFETDGPHEPASLDMQVFAARAARNDYEIPWALRDVIANPEVATHFAAEISALRGAFDDWHPRTTVLRELRRKLEPIRRLPVSRL